MYLFVYLSVFLSLANYPSICVCLFVFLCAVICISHPLPTVTIRPFSAFTDLVKRCSPVSAPANSYRTRREAALRLILPVESFSSPSFVSLGPPGGSPSDLWRDSRSGSRKTKPRVTAKVSWRKSAGEKEESRASLSLIYAS